MTTCRSSVRIAIAVALVAVALVLLAPATLVDATLAARTAGAWRIADARGFWWRGTGTLVAAGTPAQLPLSWRVRLPALLRGSLAVAVAAPAGVPVADLEADRDRLSVTKLDLRVPASLALTLAAQLSPQVAPAAAMIAAGGTLGIVAPAFEWSGGRASGNVRAQWAGARLSFPGIAFDLGDVTLDLAGKKGARGWRGSLANGGGDLALSGSVVVDGLATSGEIALAPRATAPPAIRTALAALGRPDASGSVHVAWPATR